MDLEERVELIKRGTKEIVTEKELQHLLETTESPKAYWGFEISGPIHLGMGLVCGKKIRDCVEAGVDFTIYLADLHSMINRKFGGDLQKIRRAGEYFIHSFEALGLGTDKVRFLWASDLAQDYGYWERVMQVARNASVRRVARALPIMGRETTSEDVEMAFLLYPCMQVADILEMNLDIACAGIDQRNAHMLARDVAKKIGVKKPVSLHGPLLMSLAKTGAKMGFDEDPSLSAEISKKMSKSLPQSTIHIHDSPSEIREKITGAFCPPRETDENPIVQIARHVVIPELGALEVDRSPKHGGPLTIGSYRELVDAYAGGALHPLDLKRAVAESLVKILEPVRRYFEKNPEPLRMMRSLEVTR